MHEQFKEIDPKELKLPDTVFVRDIESRVFQSVVIKCLAHIEGVALLEGNLIDHLLGREGTERIKGVHVEQDQKNHSVSVKIEINVAHGLSIPEKAEEIQTKVSEEITRLTGLHVACVHVVFKSLIPEHPIETEEACIEEVKEEESEYSSADL